MTNEDKVYLALLAGLICISGDGFPVSLIAGIGAIVLALALAWRGDDEYEDDEEEEDE